MAVFVNTGNLTVDAPVAPGNWPLTLGGNLDQHRHDVELAAADLSARSPAGPTIVNTSEGRSAAWHQTRR